MVAEDIESVEWLSHFWREKSWYKEINQEAERVVERVEEARKTLEVST